MLQRRSWILLGVVALVALFLLAACGGGGGGPQPLSGEIRVEAGEFYFKPNTVTVKAGVPVKFVVTNAGKIEHKFAFEELVAKGVEAEIEGIMPGTTQVLEMTFTEPGLYPFECSISGHAESGMKGTVTVVK